MTELHYAAYCNDPDAVRAQLQLGVPVDVRDDGGWSPLHWSIDMAQAWGQPNQVVSLLLAAGASANSVDKNGFSLLMMACGRNNGAILEQLIKAGADVQTRSAETTPLHEAAGCNFSSGIRQLLAELTQSKPTGGIERQSSWPNNAGVRNVLRCSRRRGVRGNEAARGSGNSADRLAPRSNAISLGRDPSVRSHSV